MHPVVAVAATKLPRIMIGASLMDVARAVVLASRTDRTSINKAAAFARRHPFPATGGKKLLFTADQRRRLATAGKSLTPYERRKCHPWCPEKHRWNFPTNS